MNRHWFIRMVVFLIVLLALPLVAQAQCGCPVLDPVDTVSIQGDCNNLTVSWSHSAGIESLIFIGTPSTILAVQYFPTASGSFSLDFNPPLSPDAELVVIILVADSFDVVAETELYLTDCGETYQSGCADGRLTYTACDRLAVYPIVAEDGVGLDIYSLSPGSDTGLFVLNIPGSLFEALPDTVAANCTIAASDDGQVVVYLLTTGEIQINAGPDGEGKVFEFIFRDLASAPSSIHTYMSGMTPDRLPSCAEG